MPLLSYDTETLDKIAALKEMRRLFQPFKVFELVKIHWGSPTGPVTYCSTGDALDTDLPDRVLPCQLRLLAGDSENTDFPVNPEIFQQIPLTSYLSDDEIDIEFYDGDERDETGEVFQTGFFTQLMQVYGEGARAEVFLWVPEVELLLPMWDGHLRSSDDQEETVWRGKLASGFRSPDTMIPAHPHVRDICQDVFAGAFDNQTDIDRFCASCDYNIQTPDGTFGLNDPDTGLPFTSCPKTIPACIARRGDSKAHLSHTTAADVIVNAQSSPGNNYPRTQGNETTMGKKLRVVLGQRYVHEIEPTAILKLINNSSPGNGYIKVEIREIIGPIANVIAPQINGQLLPPAQYEPRVGHQKELATNFTPDAWNFSRIAGFMGVFGRLDPTQFEIEDIRGKMICQGYLQRNYIDARTTMASSIDKDDTSIILTDASDFPSAGDIVIDEELIRYSGKSSNTLTGCFRGLEVTTECSHDEDAIVQGLVYDFSHTRAWQILEMMTDTWWGYGLSRDRIGLASWLECAEWGDQAVIYTDPLGQQYAHIRSRSDLELTEREFAKHIEDICHAGFFSRPFMAFGQLQMLPLRALTDEELGAVPRFTDQQDNETLPPNVIFNGTRSSLRIGKKTEPGDLVNRIEAKFDNWARYYKEDTVPPVEDEAAQFREGLLYGDRTRRKEPKSYVWAGVVEINQAIKCSARTLRFGPFDEGGLDNNCEIKFKIDWLDALTLYPTCVFQFVNDKLNNKIGFDHFRAKALTRNGDLSVAVTGQAYNYLALREFEQLYDDVPGPPEPPVINPPVPPTSPCVPAPSGITFAESQMIVPIEPC